MALPAATCAETDPSSALSSRPSPRVPITSRSYWPEAADREDGRRGLPSTEQVLLHRRAASRLHKGLLLCQE